MMTNRVSEFQRETRSEIKTESSVCILKDSHLITYLYGFILRVRS